MFPITLTLAQRLRLREFRIRDYHEEGKVRPYWLPGKLNVADHFSKILGKVDFEINVKRMGMSGSYDDHFALLSFNDYPVKDDLYWLNPERMKAWEQFHITRVKGYG